MVYVGSLSTAPDRDSGWVRELQNLGWEVARYSSHVNYGTGPIAKLQRRLSIGALNRHMQRGLLTLIDEIRPTWVHFRLPIAFDRQTLMSIRGSGAVITEYFNDDPFSTRAPTGLNWKFKRSIDIFHAHLAYREHNLADFARAGADVVQHCPPTYDPERHFLTPPTDTDAYRSDAAFIGHWEDDWRVDCLDGLSRAGLKVVVRGGMWDEPLKRTSLSHLRPVTHAFGPEYNKIYASAGAGLCFFSKINRDEWTERALEIVAIGGVLVCERTREAERNFIDGKEALFFSSQEELVDIVRALRREPALRAKISSAARVRLLSGKHTIRDRAEQLTGFVEKELARRVRDATGK